MEIDSGVRIRSVAWLEIFPWLRLIKALAIGFQFRMLLFAAVGLLVMEVGAAILYTGFGVIAPDEIKQCAAPPLACECAEDDSIGGPPPFMGSPPMPGMATMPDMQEDPYTVPPSAYASPIPILGQRTWWPRVLDRIVSPVSQMFAASYPTNAGFARFLYHVLTAAWIIAVWAVFGTACTRAASMELTAREAFGPRAMLGFGLSRAKSTAGAFVIPLAGLIAMGCGLALVGFLVGRWDATYPVMYVLWPLLFLVGAFMAVLGVGLMVGWPLLVAAIGTEDSDGFDAVSRTYSYVYQKPLNLLFYLVVTVLLGVIGLFFVNLLLGAALGLTDWGLAWGSDKLMTTPDSWRRTAAYLPDVFLLSYAWATASAIYILLRYDVDRAEHDTIGGLEAAAPMDGPIAAIAPNTVDEKNQEAKAEGEGPIERE